MPPPMPHPSKADPPVMPAAPPMKSAPPSMLTPLGPVSEPPSLWVHDQIIVPAPAATEVIV
jgi:hypothetical protein